MKDEIKISRPLLSNWAESLLHMNHHGTLIQRELKSGDIKRAAVLAERARKRAWKLFSEMLEYGAEKPKGYCEPQKNA